MVALISEICHLPTSHLYKGLVRVAGMEVQLNYSDLK